MSTATQQLGESSIEESLKQMLFKKQILNFNQKKSRVQKLHLNNLLDKATPHIKELSKTSIAVAKQFIPSSEESISVNNSSFVDPLLEDSHTVVKGLVHKYDNRALILLTMNCAAYCRFCTRRRKVSDIKAGIITDKDIDNMINYIISHPGIKEIIISGGDPFTVPSLLKVALEKISKLEQIKIIRIGSRLPVVHPQMVNSKLIEALSVVKKQSLYLMFHFEHPDEITSETIEAIKRLRLVSTMMFSQSVFLKGVNDSYETLYKLFSHLIEIGIKPYYIYHCDPVKGAEHFIVQLDKEIEIMTELRKNLSGLAYPTHVIDTPNGTGKIPVPLGFWKYDFSTFRDFSGVEKYPS